jgi:hypothetical protein
MNLFLKKLGKKYDKEMLAGKFSRNIKLLVMKK